MGAVYLLLQAAARRKAESQKPRLLFKNGEWWCFSNDNWKHSGRTPDEAYEAWKIMHRYE